MGCGQGNCGRCGSCGGCGGRALELTEQEVELLDSFAQTPFLPVARRWSEETPTYLEAGADRAADCAAAIMALQCKGLIRVDYDLPLVNFDYQAYEDYPCQGSMALTARGQDVVEWLSIRGIEP